MPNAGWLMCPLSMVWEMAGEPALRQVGNLYLVGTAVRREICEPFGLTRQSTLDYYRRNVQRSLIAIESLCGTRLTRGSVTMRCQPRFQTTVQIVPWPDRPTQSRICAYVLRFRVELNKARKHQIRAPSVGRLTDHKRCTKLPTGRCAKSFSIPRSNWIFPFGDVHFR